MKKLLSVFAAAAMLFGFASCSGDLHDDNQDPFAATKSVFLVGGIGDSVSDSSQYIKHFDGSEKVLDQVGYEIPLNNGKISFEFTYTGNLYGIGKTIYDSKNNTLYYESITGLDPILNNSTKFYLAPRIVYSGKPMDVKIGDDLLYITRNDNNYRKLQEEEYYFSLVSTPCWFVNGHGNKIPAGKFNMEIWVKAANDSEYIL